MLDQKRLDAIHLSGHPLGQRIFANCFLRTNYAFPLTRTRVEIEGLENLPRTGGAFLIMNHTDRYNCWPFQTEMHKRGLGYTATWVKGKYYENPLMGWFLDRMNNIPIPSKGYLLTKDVQETLGRNPTSDEYSLLKDYADGKRSQEELRDAIHLPDLRTFLHSREAALPYPLDLKNRFEKQMARIVEIHREALEKGLNLMVFPQGTRSRRLTRGHTGVAQMVLHLGVPIVPIGCSGSDRCYSGNLPLSSGGTIRYRVGAPLRPGVELSAFSPETPYLPFTPEAEKHEAKFRALTDFMMERLNELVDPEYRFEGEGKNPTLRTSQRFV
jgi:1-acyl-sn-glycerol-3-phosphate acyltransferase